MTTAVVIVAILLIAGYVFRAKLKAAYDTLRAPKSPGPPPPPAAKV